MRVLRAGSTVQPLLLLLAFLHLISNSDASHPTPNVGPPVISDLLSAMKKKLLRARAEKLPSSFSSQFPDTLTINYSIC